MSLQGGATSSLVGLREPHNSSAVYTDDFKSYEKLDGYDHQSVKHSVGEYVNDQIHINGMESFWSILKRAHKGTYHKMSAKHLNRYISEFAGAMPESSAFYLPREAYTEFCSICNKLRFKILQNEFQWTLTSVSLFLDSIMYEVKARLSKWDY